MKTTTTKEIPPIAETDSHQGRMIRANRARRARMEYIPTVCRERDELAEKCEQWVQMFDDKCKTLSQVTAQRDELQTEVMRLDGELLDVRSRNDELLAALKGLMEHYVGDRSSKTVVGESGIAADFARAAIAKVEN